MTLIPNGALVRIVDTQYESFAGKHGTVIAGDEPIGFYDVLVDGHHEPYAFFDYELEIIDHHLPQRIGVGGTRDDGVMVNRIGGEWCHKEPAVDVVEEIICDGV